jgi:hypothetical protein
MNRRMTPMEDLRKYLQNFVALRKSMGFSNDLNVRYYGAEDFVLQHGIEYKPTPLNGYRLNGPQKACFQTSYQAATRKGSKWVYVEGYALIPRLGLPTHHAWLTREDKPGCAFDPTWADIDIEQDSVVYIGVPVRPEYVKKMYELSGKFQQYSILDTWWARWPLFTGEHDVKEVIY